MASQMKVPPRKAPRNLEIGSRSDRENGPKNGRLKEQCQILHLLKKP